MNLKIAFISSILLYTASTVLAEEAGMWTEKLEKEYLSNQNESLFSFRFFNKTKYEGDIIFYIKYGGQDNLRNCEHILRTDSEKGYNISMRCPSVTDLNAELVFAVASSRPDIAAIASRVALNKSTTPGTEVNKNITSKHSVSCRSSLRVSKQYRQKVLQTGDYVKRGEICEAALISASYWDQLIDLRRECAVLFSENFSYEDSYIEERLRRAERQVERACG